MAFTDADSSNDVKAAFHGALGALAAVTAVYNIAAFVKRPAPHLAINALIYTSLVGLEITHVLHHGQWRKVQESNLQPLRATP